MQRDCYIITLLYDHDNRYSFSFSLQKLLQHCMYLWPCKSVKLVVVVEVKW